MKKQSLQGQKVKGALVLASKNGIPFVATVMSERKVYGRDEVLVEVSQMGQFWVQKKGVSKIKTKNENKSKGKA